MKGSKLVYLLAIFLTAVLVNAMEIGPGPVSGDWYATGNPYNVNGEIIIPVDSTLNIHPGVNVIFQGHYKLIVYGYLEAMAVEGDSITFDAANPTTGWHGIRFLSAQDSSHLSYCVIQHGFADGTGPEDPDAWGGGILCDESNPVITHCVIRDNRADYFDGGIGITNASNPLLSYCTIAYNTAYESEGGIGIASGSDPIISHCQIRNNTATNHGAGVVFWQAQGTLSFCTINDNTSDTHAGAGIFIQQCSPTITNCTIANNTTSVPWNGGGIYIQGSPSNPLIENCHIVNNTAGGEGGGIRISYLSNAVITGCSISRNTAASNGGGISCDNFTNPVVTNCDISGNSAAYYGGGIEFSNAHGEISYCTISGNTAGIESGGIECNSGSSPIISNCTISGNTATLGSGGGMCTYEASPEVKNTIFQGNFGGGVYFLNSPDADFSYCDFHDNQGYNFTGDPTPGLGELVGTNINGDSCDTFMNIFMDPCFVDPIGGDYHLLALSPCIDAGDPSSPFDPDSTICDIGRYYYDQGIWVDEKLGFLHPAAFKLFPNYPNPFNASTVLKYSLLQPGTVTLTVHNILGQRVATLFQGRQQSGVYTVTWDASGFSSGVYFSQLQANEVVAVKKMILLK